MRFAQVILDESMAIVAQAAGSGGTPGEWRNLDIALDMFDVLRADWQEREAAYERGQPISADRLHFLAPITRPGKILAIGQNYMDHIVRPEKPLLVSEQ